MRAEGLPHVGVPTIREPEQYHPSMVRTSCHKMLPVAASINTVRSTLSIAAAPPWSLGGACRRRPRRGAEHHGHHRHRQRHRLEVGADWQRRRTEANARARHGGGSET
jgi:hypothetical protein